MYLIEERLLLPLCFLLSLMEFETFTIITPLSFSAMSNGSTWPNFGPSGPQSCGAPDVNTLKSETSLAIIEDGRKSKLIKPNRT